MSTLVKICGIKEPAALKAAVESGADFVGFVFYPPSPRYIEPEQAAHLIRMLPATVRSVGLFVDPDEETLRRVTAVAPLDFIQLHGEETPSNIGGIKSYLSQKIIKSIRIGSKNDLAEIKRYALVSDWILFDSKVIGSALPGGTGERFDWSILKDVKPPLPWMLAGGLTAQNVAEGIMALHPTAVDVSSGVEDAPGQKSSEKIKDFIAAAKSV